MPTEAPHIAVFLPKRSETRPEQKDPSANPKKMRDEIDSNGRRKLEKVKLKWMDEYVSVVWPYGFSVSHPCLSEKYKAVMTQTAKYKSQVTARVTFHRVCTFEHFPQQQWIKLKSYLHTASTARTNNCVPSILVKSNTRRVILTFWRIL